MDIPWQFEYNDVLYHFKNHPTVRKYVTVLEKFAHHYTGTNFFRIRIEYVSYMTENYPVVEYATVDEEQIARMVKNVNYENLMKIKEEFGI